MGVLSDDHLPTVFEGDREMGYPSPQVGGRLCVFFQKGSEIFNAHPEKQILVVRLQEQRDLTFMNEGIGERNRGVNRHFGLT